MGFLFVTFPVLFASPQDATPIPARPERALGGVRL